MSKPLVVLCRGHSSTSVGAVQGKIVEYDKIPVALSAMEIELRAYGVQVVRAGGYDTLTERQNVGIRLIREHRRRYPGARCVYVSAHINSAGARHVAFAHPDSDMGRAACGTISRLSRLASDVARPDGHKGQQNAYACIERVYRQTREGCCGILIEFHDVGGLAELEQGCDTGADDALTRVGQDAGEALARFLLEATW